MSEGLGFELGVQVWVWAYRVQSSGFAAWVYGLDGKFGLQHSQFGSRDLPKPTRNDVLQASVLGVGV